MDACQHRRRGFPNPQKRFNDMSDIVTSGMSCVLSLYHRPVDREKSVNSFEIDHTELEGRLNEGDIRALSTLTNSVHQMTLE